MRARTELLIASGVAIALLVVAFASGRRVRGDDDPDPRASSFLTGREGTRALADAAERLGVKVVRWRQRPQRLADQGDTGSTVLVLGPARPISAPESRQFAALVTSARGANLVLAGESSEAAMRCFGYLTLGSVFDSSRVATPGRDADSAAAWVHGRLVAIRDSARAARSPTRRRPALEGEEEACPKPIVTSTDTLLLTTNGKPAMLRLTIAPFGRSVVLLGDASLVRNRTLRSSSTAPLVVDAVLPRRGSAIFDEYHHGYGAAGSMAGVALDWSRRNPLGWMVWQLAAVGFIALLIGGVRFGPVRATLGRVRRSPLEHVRALATALASARGHRTAVAAMVRGLRRRLAPATTPSTSRDDWKAWLATLAARAPNAESRASAERLLRLTENAESETAVLSAANAVEDLWHSLRP